MYKINNPSINHIIIASLLILGIILGAYVGFVGFSPLMAAMIVAIFFMIITLIRPCIAIYTYFLFIPLETLFVAEGSFTSTLTKLLGAYLVFILVSSGSLKYVHEVLKKKKAILIVGYGLVCIISIYFSKDSSHSIKFLLRLWLLIISYFTLIMMIRNIRTLNYALFALVAGTVLSVLSPIFSGYGDIEERFRGLWGDPNEFAGMLLVLIPFCIAIIFTTEKKNLKIIFSVCTAVLFAGFLLTYSRSGFIAFCVMCVVTIFKFIRGKNRLRILGVLVPCLIIGFIVIYYTIGDDIVSRLETLRILESRESVRTERSLNLRYYYYFELFPKLFVEHPLMGVGFRGFVLNNPIYKQISHNTFIEVLIGTGLLGFVPFVTILILT